ncbi:uncharacterized protein PADG_11896 [Paracoccidioides brasiliensis Pb18]|uniref:Uncharacterized protein n=1 Tax=Paracoccidioides brasiliensis (strain Pb18) TaxID=502780 RepID=A0A0A0HUA9_PARBD|nr:uncharacterized protein PADG_11896 [Paracoccidioides brasiliensis Pb18]KGM91923.1 hypothetical protein PADG_11896 [Paracoccidioides brasiliensis Pb18]
MAEMPKRNDSICCLFPTCARGRRAIHHHDTALRGRVSCLLMEIERIHGDEPQLGHFMLMAILPPGNDPQLPLFWSDVGYPLGISILDEAIHALADFFSQELMLLHYYAEHLRPPNCPILYRRLRPARQYGHLGYPSQKKKPSQA